MWRERAACLDDRVDPAWFDPDHDHDPGFKPTRAMRICQGCPVRADCLEEALSVPMSDDGGVWGGTSTVNRNRIRQGRMTREQAMAAGDRTAAMRTAAERRQADEPWLATAQVGA